MARKLRWLRSLFLATIDTNSFGLDSVLISKDYLQKNPLGDIFIRNWARKEIQNEPPEGQNVNITNRICIKMNVL